MGYEWWLSELGWGKVSVCMNETVSNMRHKWRYF